MKASLFILMCSFFMFGTLVHSADTNAAIRVERELLDMEQQMLDIDIKLTLAQYERIQKQLMELRFEEQLRVVEEQNQEQKNGETRRALLEEVLTSKRNETMVKLRDLARRRGENAARKESMKAQH